MGLTGLPRVRRISEVNDDIALTAGERLDIWTAAPGQGPSEARAARLRTLETRLNGDSRQEGLYAEKREVLAWPQRLSA